MTAGELVLALYIWAIPVSAVLLFVAAWLFAYIKSGDWG